MTCERVTLVGCGTGRIETPAAIRHSLAFDLRHIDLRGRSLIRAMLQWPATIAYTPIRSVRLSDPGSEVEYGNDGGQSGPTGAALQAIDLTADALADLQQASGAFFALDAVCQDDHGDPVSLPDAIARQVWVVAIEHVPNEQAAA